MEAASPSVAIDVSNTLDSIRLSGVQRLTLRVIEQLAGRPDDVEMTLLDGRSGQLRMVSSPQRTRLLGHFDRRPHSVGSRIERRVARRVPSGSRWVPRTEQWLVDLEPSWHAIQPREALLPTIGCRSAALIHDLLPLQHPDWFPPTSVVRFSSWFDAHVAADSRLLANSHATAADVADWLGITTPPPVLRLGVDQQRNSPKSGAPTSHGLVLMVGTIEPRKSHALLLDALDLMSDPPMIDVVGSAGWVDDSLLSRLEGHPHVRWHQGLNDTQLAELFQRASLLVQPSMAEGFGLPVAEALSRGVPVMASDLPVFAEASKGSAELLALNPLDWADALSQFVNDDEYRRELQEAAAAFEPWSWTDTANDLLAVLA